ncbi:hypothetical protein NKJ13_30895 [Mesorhizobium sp. M0174]|uniref:hypothetical protein n=1 Tax=Mesorhizobium sp. M0174 TaxID=2956904 RepID=UPI003337AB3E
MDEIFEQPVHLYDSTPVLAAAYDGFDRPRYANQAFVQLSSSTPRRRRFWSDLMRRNFRLVKELSFESGISRTLWRVAGSG